MTDHSSERTTCPVCAEAWRTQEEEDRGLCDECAQPEPCPMGCGRTTDDVAGGPCSACWEKV